MARPEERPSFPDKKAPVHKFAVPATPIHHSSLQYNTSQPTTLSFGSSFTSTNTPSSNTLSSQTAPHQGLLDDNLPLLSNEHLDLQQDTTELLSGSLPSNYIPQIYKPKVSPHQPWNPHDVVTTSMKTQSDQYLSTPQSNRKRPPPDSGYASSSKRSQQFVPSAVPETDLAAGVDYTFYDETINSAVQQNLFLPDQQGALTSRDALAPPTIATSSVTSGEPTPSEPSSQTPGHPLYCKDCKEEFNTKSEKAKHMARHSKKFLCNVSSCERSQSGFATKNDLDRHKAGVHNDASVPRKEYKCCAPGCKDPNKIWDRKDNFKAHVVRMHPEVDPNECVAASEIRARPPSNQSQSLAGSINQERSPYGYSLQLHQQSLPHMLPSNINYGYTFSQPFEANPDPYGEGDMYDASTPAGQGLTQFHQQQPEFSPGQSGFLQPGNRGPSATIGNSNYALSNTMAAPTTPQDPMAASIMAQQTSLPFAFGNFSHMRPTDARTMPLVGVSQDDYQASFTYGQTGDASSVNESGMTPIDPVVGSGGWVPASQSNMNLQSTDLGEQQQPSTLTLLPGEHLLPPDQSRDHSHIARLFEQMKQMFGDLSDEEVEKMFLMYRKHPPTPNKATCFVKTALNAIKPESRSFQCSYSGCKKTFPQKSRLTRHEKRHNQSFFCTFDGCYSTSGTKDDFRRHETQTHKTDAFEGWRCFHDDNPGSRHKLECTKFFDNEASFIKHRTSEHKERAASNNRGLKALKACHIKQGSPGQFWCGFCNKVIQNEPDPIDGTALDKFRYAHIDHHITKEKKKMNKWVDLKSEGLTKTEVRAGNPQQAGFASNDESDEEEDLEQATPLVSAMFTNPASQKPGSSTQQAGTSSIGGQGRKRAHSDAEIHTTGSVTKIPRTGDFQTSRQNASATVGGSNIATSTSIPVTLGANRPPSSQVTLVQCCLCHQFRHYNAGALCNNNNPACRHKWCLTCIFWDYENKRVYARPNPGGGQGSGT